jgi:hypothetical protein
MSFEEWNEDEVKVVEHAFHAHANLTDWGEEHPNECLH